MNWNSVVVVLSIVTANVAINRPVYKVVLTQKGYTQFLQYDLETPPLREFTFCTWIRTYDLGADQSIFTYVANGNTRVMRLWLDSGGQFLKLAVKGKAISKIPVEIVKDVWRHVCLSYQSDYGAWAVYVDSKLSLCETDKNLNGFILPGGGSVIIGYGATDNDEPSGFEGEMFGANMLLVSTIERNHSISIDQYYQEMRFKKNQIKDNDKNKYVIFKDLKTEAIQNNFEKAVTPVHLNKTNSFIKITTPHSFISHSVGLEHTSAPTKTFDLSNEKEFLDVPSSSELHTTEAFKNSYWATTNNVGPEVNVKFKKIKKQLATSTTKDFTISEYETPPPPPPPPKPKSFYEMNYNSNGNIKNYFRKKGSDVLSNVEMPPPPQNDKKVYGQWTSSKFAGSVLNYLKSINYRNREKKVPATIPLVKTSDSFPYTSDFRVTKIKPAQFPRMKFIDHKVRLHKRDITKLPEINVQIIEDDIRGTILKMHAVTEPKNVEVTNRGEPKTIKDHRFYRNTDVSPNSAENSGSTEDIYKPRPFRAAININKQNKVPSDFEGFKNQNLLTILPFLKTLEYFVDDDHHKTQEKEKDNVLHSSDMYSKSLENGNKWHNIKSYNNDYTPRRINIDSNDGSSDIDHKIAEANKKQPSLRLKYKHEKNNKAKEPNIIKGRELAKGVSNQSSKGKESISIVKYNHGYLPSHESKGEAVGKQRNPTKSKSKYNRVNGKSNFNKQVKLGNALNERDVLGHNDEQKKKSFEGGNEKVPDINRYRSDIDNENANVPSSLKSKLCRNVNSMSRSLYIHRDESIVVSHIDSPLRKKNIAVKFIHVNYNQCSLEGSKFEKSYLLFIDWRITPVRLFGGAKPKRTTDLCGFF